jgi:hypothetical protein
MAHEGAPPAVELGGWESAALRAGSTVRLTGSQAVLAGLPGGAGSGQGFLVDPERAQAAIATLTGVIHDLEAGMAELGLRWTRAPGIDPVSVRLGENMELMRQRALAYVLGWTEQIEATRDALQAQVDAYRRVDESNAGSRA